MFLTLVFNPFLHKLFILSVLIYLFHSTIAQSIGNTYRNQDPRHSARGPPYPEDYYERYPPYDSYRPWNPGQEHANFPDIGLKSRYGDSRCIADGYYNESLKPSVTVRTRLGNVEGTYVYLCDAPGVSEYERPRKQDQRNPFHKPIKIHKSVAIFLGIPYAKPPTRENNLRFKPPQFLPSFSIVRALEYKEACPQDVIYYGFSKGVPDTSEDCLYLNIFTPSVEKINEKYAVMIYIHGGFWDRGSANVFPAHMLAASQEVVVVTFNFRLGPLGFFATGDNSSAGNYGLLDQAMAIEWVRDNIDAFNGDPNLITLFGPGTGAASAGIHVLSNRMKDKTGIMRVIAQSGSAVAGWATIPDHSMIYNNSLEFAKMMWCNYETTWRIVECLRDLEVARFQKTQLQFKPKTGWLPWAPVIDAFTRDFEKQILSASPEMLLDQAKEFFLDGYMAGVTKDDGLVMVDNEDYLKGYNYQLIRDKFLDVIREYPSMYNYTIDPKGLVKAISFLYVPCDNKAENITRLRQNFIDMLSDSYFNGPNDKILKLLMEKKVKTYMYVLNNTAEGIRKVKDRGVFNMSVPHDSEFYFITGAPFMDPNLYPRILQLKDVEWTEADRNMSQFFMTAFANFAKFGNPTPFPIMDSISWGKCDSQNMQYLLVNTTNFTSVMMSGYRQKESQFWNEYIPDFMQLPLYIWPPTYQPWELQRNIYEASLYGVVGATMLFLILSFLCCCLYCRAKSKHLVSTEDIPDAISTTPSSIDTLLNMKKMERNQFAAQRMEAEQKHTQV